MLEKSSIFTFTFLISTLIAEQAGRRINEDQLASLSSEKTVNEFLESQRVNITAIIKQMLAVGEIFKCEGLQVMIYFLEIF